MSATLAEQALTAAPSQQPLPTAGHLQPRPRPGGRPTAGPSGAESYSPRPSAGWRQGSRFSRPRRPRPPTCSPGSGRLGCWAPPPACIVGLSLRGRPGGPCPAPCAGLTGERRAQTSGSPQAPATAAASRPQSTVRGWLLSVLTNRDLPCVRGPLWRFLSLTVCSSSCHLLAGTSGSTRSLMSRRPMSRQCPFSGSRFRAELCATHKPRRFPVSATGLRSSAEGSHSHSPLHLVPAAVTGRRAGERERGSLLNSCRRPGRARPLQHCPTERPRLPEVLRVSRHNLKPAADFQPARADLGIRATLNLRVTFDRTPSTISRPSLHPPEFSVRRAQALLFILPDAALHKVAARTPAPTCMCRWSRLLHTDRQRDLPKPPTRSGALPVSAVTSSMQTHFSRFLSSERDAPAPRPRHLTVPARPRAVPGRVVRAAPLPQQRAQGLHQPASRQL